MQQFANILLFYQGRIGDEAMLDRAIALARDNGADLTLATSVQPDGAGERRARLVAEHRRHLQRLAAGIRPGNFSIRCEVLVGRPEDDLTRLVRERGIDLAMMTADDENLFGAMAPRSPTIRCMRRAPCPVWVSRPCRNGEAGRILAAVKPAEVDAPPSSLDFRILETAATLARQRAGRLDILLAWELAGDRLETSRSEITEDIRERLLACAASTCTGAIARLCEAVDLDGLETTVHLPRGNAVDEIVRFTENCEVDLIVMGTACRTGLPAFFYGNPAEEVLMRVATPVLTVTPQRRKVVRPPLDRNAVPAAVN